MSKPMQAKAASAAMPVKSGQLGPIGQKLQGNLGPGTLFPGAGKLVQRSGQPLYCGRIVGNVFGFIEHPNNKDAKRTSTRFAGNFLLVDHNGIQIAGYECYLPGTVERAIKAALHLRGGQGDPIPLAIEVWCEPDVEGRPPSPLGYQYVTYDRAPKAENDPVLAMAYASGILERPQAQLTDQSEAQAQPGPGEMTDPETGEVITRPLQHPAEQQQAGAATLV